MKGNKTPYAIVDGVIFNTRSQLRKARKENPSLKGVEYKREKPIRKAAPGKTKRIRSKRRTIITEKFTQSGISNIRKRLKNFTRRKKNHDKISWITINAKFKKFKDTDVTKEMEEVVGFKSSHAMTLKILDDYLKETKTPEDVLDFFEILLPSETLDFDYKENGLPDITISIQDPPIFSMEFPK